jgi:hypothetical protein
MGWTGGSMQRGGREGGRTERSRTSNTTTVIGMEDMEGLIRMGAVMTGRTADEDVQ